MTDKAPCKKCQSEISAEAIACPECGYEPRNQGFYSRTVMAIVGIILSLTVIGAVVGVPLIIISVYAHWKNQSKRPTETEPV